MSDLQDIVRATHLAAAQSAISKHGRYWFFEMRPAANVLVAMLREMGYEVLLHELAPDWEHVVSLTSNSVKDTVAIAQSRAAQRANGVSEASLPM